MRFDYKILNDNVENTYYGLSQPRSSTGDLPVLAEAHSYKKAAALLLGE
ncbi:hypothetical protein [Pseudovibrio ascidiaceicola]|nr:hypothetical protein [Pseudovibrio ascidiaceicola]